MTAGSDNRLETEMRLLVLLIAASAIAATAAPSTGGGRFIKATFAQ